MRKPYRFFILLTMFVCQSLNLVSWASPVEPAPVSFGFFSESGRLILEHIKPEEPLPVFDHAVCKTNRLHALQFLSLQPSGPRKTGRHTAKNFDQLPGSVYSAIDSQAIPNESCLLATSSFIGFPTLLKQLPSSSSDISLSADEIERIEAVKQRRVARNWQLIETANGAKLALVVFEAIGENALASLVLTTADSAIFRDYPAKIRPYSTWRVDDGGEIVPKQFNILLLRQRNQIWELATEFLGAEGSLLEFSIGEGTRFETVRRSYRYTSPI